MKLISVTGAKNLFDALYQLTDNSTKPENIISVTLNFANTWLHRGAYQIIRTDTEGVTVTTDIDNTLPFVVDPISFKVTRTNADLLNKTISLHSAIGDWWCKVEVSKSLSGTYSSSVQVKTATTIAHDDQADWDYTQYLLTDATALPNNIQCTIVYYS